MDDDSDLLSYTNFLDTFDSFSEGPILPLSSDTNCSYTTILNDGNGGCYLTETPIETPSKQLQPSEQTNTCNMLEVKSRSVLSSFPHTIFSPIVSENKPSSQDISQQIDMVTPPANQRFNARAPRHEYYKAKTTDQQKPVVPKKRDSYDSDDDFSDRRKKSQPWTEEEDNYLRYLVKVNNYKNWAQVAHDISMKFYRGKNEQRSANQCN